MALKKWQKPPKTLITEIAIDEWKRMVKVMLDEKHEFTEKDLRALEGYCMSYSKWVNANRILEEKGSTVICQSGYEQQRAEVSIANKAEDEMRNWMKELGFTQASRARMNKNNNIKSPKDDYTDEDKQMEGLIS